MSGVRELLRELSALGVKVSAEAGQLRVRAPKNVLGEELRGRLSSHKDELLAMLSRDASAADALPLATPDLAARHEPFPLTDIQQAYWIGASGGLEGGGSYHYYLEFDCLDVDISRLNRAWDLLVERHEMLRAVILPDGGQRILERVSHQPFVVHDMTAVPDETAALSALRDELSHRDVRLDRWPLSEIRVSRLAGGRCRIHVSLGLIVLDSGSMMIIFDEWQKLYRDENAPLAPLPTSFRDYVFAERALETTSQYKAAERYWLDRLPDLPPAPELPLARKMPLGESRFERMTGRLDATSWLALKQRATRFGVTPSALLLAAFSEILATWSENARFTLNLTLFNRLPLGEGIENVVGDFTSVTLLAVDFSERRPFIAHASEINRRLRDDLDNRAFPGVRVLREWARMQGGGGRPLAPVVFSSTLVLDTASDFSLYKLFGGDLAHAISQTPQCFLDHQLLEDDGQLIFHWDVVRGYYPEGMVEDMFAAYAALLARLAGGDAAFEEIREPHVPQAQRDRRAAVNATDAPVIERTPIDLFRDRLAERPNAPAIIAGERTLSYRELDLHARSVAHWLRGGGVLPQELVAISMEKGWEQVAAVLGTLMAGAAYMPLDASLPELRREHLLRNGDVRFVLTQSPLAANFGSDFEALAVDLLPLDPEAPEPTPGSPADLAYVLYTSGSTGMPKGVMIDGRSIVNRMSDVVSRFGLTSDDRAVALTALHHDLSVFDIFGMLCCAGGAIVIPDHDKLRDPGHWCEIMEQGGVTVWNSVPAFMSMLVEHLESQPRVSAPPLRWCILSGDFIPVPLPDRMRALIPDLAIVAAGGPTETTVWDICNPLGDVDTNLPSIPYGKPMANARYHVLKDDLQPCPDWTPGELCIGGLGLARGYWRDDAANAAKFVTHPQTGERLYRSGDMGRWLPDGNIEILARRDFQVKIQGQRIELGEIEAALNALPEVERAVVTVAGDGPERRRLVAHVVPAARGEAGAAPGVAVEKMDFKLDQPGRRRFAPGHARVALPQRPASEADRAKFLARQSQRRFTGEPVPQEELSAMLAGLRQMPVEGAPLPKYLYPSAGSLYPVQVYLHAKEGGVAGLDAGFFYYDPEHHALLPLGESVSVGIYGGPNAQILESCGFVIFLVGDVDAVEPVYPGAGRDFCLLEAGHVGQILMQRAGETRIGLCALGIGVDEPGLRAACGLGPRHTLLYTMAGARIDAAARDHWTTYPPRGGTRQWHEPIRDALAARLPPHMVPTSFVRRDAFPLTANGKIDRRALSEAAPERLANVASGPASEVETRLAAILAELLGVESVGVHTQFFELGASSVTLVQFRNRLRQEWDREIPMAEMFSRSSVHLLAGLFEGDASTAGEDALRASVARAGRQKRARAGNG
jgi:epothilone synthetase B